MMAQLDLMSIAQDATRIVEAELLSALDVSEASGMIN
jgi:hypothetical protein